MVEALTVTAVAAAMVVAMRTVMEVVKVYRFSIENVVGGVQTSST